MIDTGFPRADVDNDFLRARRHQVLATLAHRLRRQPDTSDRLLQLDEITGAVGMCGERQLGLRTIPLDGVGRQLQALGVAEQAQFNCASALVNYILGLAGQYAAAARLIPRETDRSAFLATVAVRWAQLDPAKYPFVHQVAAQLPEHDDREQFLAGIDLILAGITTVQ
jgi:hypothetical protein